MGWFFAMQVSSSIGFCNEFLIGAKYAAIPSIGFNIEPLIDAK
jgi:hypothetical protein